MSKGAIILKSDAGGRVLVPVERQVELVREFERSGLSGPRFAFLPLVDDLVVGVAFLVGRFLGQLVPVRHHHPPLVHQRAQGMRGHVELVEIISRRVVGPEHLEPLLDCEVRRHDQDTVGEARIGGLTAPVAKGPGDEHGHHHRLPAARSHLAAVADKRGPVRVYRLVGKGREEIRCAGRGGKIRSLSTNELQVTSFSIR